MNAAQNGVFRLGTSVSFGDTGAAQARAFHSWFGNPFTYPASLLSRCETGCRPDGTIGCRPIGSSAIRCALRPHRRRAATTVADLTTAGTRRRKTARQRSAGPPPPRPADPARPRRAPHGPGPAPAFTYPGATPQTIDAHRQRPHVRAGARAGRLGDAGVRDRDRRVARTGQPPATRVRLACVRRPRWDSAATDASSPPPWTTFACRNAD